MRGIVLLYHRIVEVDPDPWGLSVTPAHFAEHLEALHRMARLVSLGTLTSGENPDRRAVALTFDDGYADNASRARPLLEQFDAPATVFVATGSVGDDEFWWDELCRLVWDEAESGARWRAWREPSTPRQAAYRTAWDKMRMLPLVQRRQALDLLQARGAPSGQIQSRPLSHRELASLAQCELIELGCHTRTHPVLSALDVTEQRDEIVGSRRDLHEMTGKQATAFAYPYGHYGDYSAASIDLVRQAGFHVACVNEASAVRAEAGLLEVPRIHVDDWDGDQFERELSTWLARPW